MIPVQILILQSIVAISIVIIILTTEITITNKHDSIKLIHNISTRYNGV